MASTDKTYWDEMLETGEALHDIVPIESEEYFDLVHRVLAEPEKPLNKTGLSALDNLFGGFEDGRLYILSAPTKQGKSLMAQTIMYHMAEKGLGSLMFSYEMGWQEIIRKFYAMDQYHHKDAPTKLPMYIPTDMYRKGGDLQYKWILNSIQQAQKKRDIKLAVIDHLHFLLPLKELSNPSFIIGGIVREIKRIAVQCNIPIILIAHVTKISDDKVPDWTNIRDSSFITQEADAVLMMYRKKDPDAAKRVSDDSSISPYTNKTVLSLELDRSKGRTGKIILWHNGVMFEKYHNQDGKNEEVNKQDEINKQFKKQYGISNPR